MGNPRSGMTQKQAVSFVKKMKPRAIWGTISSMGVFRLNFVWGTGKYPAKSWVFVAGPGAGQHSRSPVIDFFKWSKREGSDRYFKNHWMAYSYWLAHREPRT